MAEQKRDSESQRPNPTPGVSGEWTTESARSLELVQLLPEPALLLAADGRVLAANAAACTLFVRDVQGFLGLDSAELFSVEQRELYRACLLRIKAGAGSMHRELMADCSGKLVPLEVSLGAGRGSPPVFVTLLRRARLPYSDLLLGTANAVQDALLNGESSATIIKRFLERAALSPDCVSAQFWTLEDGRAELFRQTPRDALDDADGATLAELEALAYRAGTSPSAACTTACIARPGLASFPAIALSITGGDVFGSVVLKLDERADAELAPEVARVLELTGMLLGQGLLCARLCAERERLRGAEHSLRRRAEETADTAHRTAQESSRTLAVVSHDLRNLLSSLSLNLDLLARRPSVESGSLEQQSLERARRSTLQMRSIVEDLQQAAADRLGSVELHRAEHDVAGLLAEAVETQSVLAEGRGVTLFHELPAAPCSVWADRQRVLQVLNNLIGNAIKFTTAPGSIVVSAEQRGADICFAVKDSGVGIAPEHLERVFDSHYQADGNRQGGIGLGLSIARNLVEAHGGTIRVESEPGAGTTVFFTLQAGA